MAPLAPRCRSFPPSPFPPIPRCPGLLTDRFTEPVRYSQIPDQVSQSTLYTWTDIIPIITSPAGMLIHTLAHTVPHNNTATWAHASPTMMRTSGLTAGKHCYVEKCSRHRRWPQFRHSFAHKPNTHMALYCTRGTLTVARHPRAVTQSHHNYHRYMKCPDTGIDRYHYPQELASMCLPEHGPTVTTVTQAPGCTYTLMLRGPYS